MSANQWFTMAPVDPSLLPRLAWFARIARHRSFARAADEMRVSRAAVSQSLKALEKHLGVRLVHRTTRAMSLTEEGQRLLDALVPTLGEIEHAVRSVGDAATAPSGVVRINTSRIAARVLIEPWLPELQARYPEVKIELILADALSNIIAEGSDVGIRLGRSLAEHVVAVAVSPPLSMAVAASPAYLERHGIPEAPSDLARHDCIGYRLPGTGALRPWDFDEPGKTIRHFTQAVSGSVVVNDDQVMTRAAVRGTGLLQIVDLAIRDELADGRLVRVLRGWSHRHPGFYLYAPSREHMPSKVRAVVDFLKEKRKALSRSRS